MPRVYKHEVFPTIEAAERYLDTLIADGKACSGLIYESIGYTMECRTPSGQYRWVCTDGRLH